MAKSRPVDTVDEGAGWKGYYHLTTFSPWERPDYKCVFD